ncbi:MAG TPA: DUF3052 family protein [Candidatus Saccharimonadales bacterium]
MAEAEIIFVRENSASLKLPKGLQMDVRLKTGFIEKAKPNFINADSEIYKLFGADFDSSNYDGHSEISWLMAFYKNSSSMISDMVIFITKLNHNGQIWLAWPKKASKVKTDLSDNVVRKIGLEAGLVDVKVVSVNQTWSALKFVFRTQDR